MMNARRNLAWAAGLGLAAMALVAVPSGAQEGGSTPAAAAAGTTFIEQFDAPLDSTFWYTSDNYNNGSWQNCQFNKNNAKVANSILSLSIDDAPYGDRDYSCGSVQTNQKYGYGTYETRMKAGKASGTNSAFFTYAGPYQDVPQSHEIDFETLGKDTTKTEVNSWVNGAAKGPGIVDLGVDNSVEWVDLAFVWTEDDLTFYVNGVEKYSFTGSDVPYEPQLIIPMIWSSGTLTDWMGPFEYPGQPVVAQYDYVAYTALGDECQFEGSVACGVEAPAMSYLDNFDTLDTSKWYVSNGWNDSASHNCQWDADQVAAAGGTLNLSFAKQATGDKQYACAELQYRKQRGYGAYEARVKGVPGSGLMSTVFTYVAASGSSPAESVDLAKLLGKDTSMVNLNTWIDNQSQAAKNVALATPFDQAFTDYGLVWTAERMDFYVNGQVVHSITDPAKIPDRETNLFLSIWGSDSNPDMGDFVDPGQTLTYQVDRVAYTAPGEPCQFEGSIAC